ncbi:MAG: hypothetical protein HQ581_21420 [Planctomycetes bacterium]|nr:hypothetical protein [Planctomycetota bacterium]
MAYSIMMPRAVARVKRIRADAGKADAGVVFWLVRAGAAVYGSMQTDARLTGPISAEDGQETFHNGKQE